MTAPIAIPGPDARRCLDCAAIYAYSAACPRCGSAAQWPEDAWLERKESKLMVEHEGTKTRMRRQE